MTLLLTTLADPRYEDEVSGCTASVGVITHDKIYVVSQLYTYEEYPNITRPILATPEAYSASKVARNLFPMTTNPRMKVYSLHTCFACYLTLTILCTGEKARI